MAYTHSKKGNKKDEFKHMSGYDKYELSLLNLQLRVVLIYMISDIFLFKGTIESINLSCNKEETHINPFILLDQGQILALIGSVLISYVDFSRYNQLSKRQDKKKKSIEPEYLIRQASIFSIVLYTLNIIAVTEQYKASLIIDFLKCDKNDINILYLQADAFIVRFFGDYFWLRATLKSIHLIRSKYDKGIKKIYNPDIDAVIAAELYVIQRGVLYDISYYILLKLINEGTDINKELLLPAQSILVIANIFGVIANITTLVAFIKIYNRNANEPVFGR